MRRTVAGQVDSDVALNSIKFNLDSNVAPYNYVEPNLSNHFCASFVVWKNTL